MDITTTYKLFTELSDNEMCFAYQGSFTNKIIATASDFISKRLEANKGFGKLRNKLSFLMIESYQNIVRYGDDAQSKKHVSGDELFITKNIGNSFYVISVNIIDNNKIPFVKEKLERVNTLSGVELKKLYRDILTNKKLTEAGGAGLGFIEMVRKTKEKLIFDFEKINETQSSFYLVIRLKGKSQVEDKHIYSIDKLKNLHNLIKVDNIQLIQKGNFSQEALRPLITMVNNNIAGKKNFQRKIFHLIVELIQNISLHSYKESDKNDAIFLMGVKNSTYYLSTGNYIMNKDVDGLKQYLHKLNTLDYSALSELYRETLVIDRDEDLKGGGLGLIDIERETKENIHFKFYKVDENLTFFSLLVKI